MTDDEETLEDIAEQNSQHGNTRDHRGRKRGRWTPNHLVSTDAGKLKQMLAPRRRKMKPITLPSIKEKT